MTSTEQLVVAMLEGDIRPMLRFARNLSDDDLASLLEGTSKLRQVAFVEQGRREDRAAAEGSEAYRTAMEIIGSRA